MSREPKIIFQDEAIVILEKPAGMPSVSVKPDVTDPNTVEGWLQKKFPQAQLVHRLDNETSGLMVAALTEESFQILRDLWKTNRVTKKYTALVLGRTPSEGTITLPIAHHPKKKQKMIVGEGKTREAHTEYKTIQSFKNYSLVEVEIKTGVRHQIRAHFSFLGYPLAGDKIYQKTKKPLPLNHHFLHLSFIRLQHPLTQKVMEWQSPLPNDLKKILADL